MTVKAEGVGNAEGEVEANNIKFCLDLLAVTVAPERQTRDHKADETGVYFADGGYNLNDTSKAALDQLIAANSYVDGYVVEIAGYTSSTGSAQYSETLSEKRAAVVARYLCENAGVPMWRIAVPAGYGVTYPAADNFPTKERNLDRRVEVKIRVNTGLQEDSLQEGLLQGGL